jgi:hypothetical protein
VFPSRQVRRECGEGPENARPVGCREPRAETQTLIQSPSLVVAAVIGATWFKRLSRIAVLMIAPSESGLPSQKRPRSDKRLLHASGNTREMDLLVRSRQVPRFNVGSAFAYPPRARYRACSRNPACRSPDGEPEHGASLVIRTSGGRWR